MYGKYVNSVQKTSIKRQWICYRNKLVKLLMINGKTKERKKYKKKGNIYDILLHKKNE